MRRVTLRDLRTRLEQLTNKQNSRQFSTDEKNQLIAYATAEFWDLLIDAGLAEQFVKKVRFNAVPGQLEYKIDDDDGIVTDQDFYKISALYVDEGNGHLRPIDRINPAELTYFQPPQVAVPMVLYYIRAAPTFRDEDEKFDDELTVEGFNGFDEYIVYTAALSMKIKGSEDYAQVYRRQQELKARVIKMANTDWSGPSRVVRRWNRKYWDPFLPFFLNVTQWGIRGGKLELYANNTGVGAYP